MSSTDFGKGTQFDSSKMAYDITGTPRFKENVVYPMGVSQRDSSPFSEKVEPLIQKVEKPKTTDVKIQVPEGSKVEIQPTMDVNVTPAQAIGLEPLETIPPQSVV